VVYHVLSFERNEDVRVKVPLSGDLTGFAVHHHAVAIGELV
jgi:NADH:ubiquinone oxidoreductase subunit C